MLSKKEELLTNVAKIINEEGIQKLTMQYLAEKSGITKGGVLYHFDSKEILLLNMNKMVIEQFEGKINKYKSKLSGAYQFTRAYALATIDYLDDTENVLLPSVFISSLEDGKSKELWESVSEHWIKLFDQDKGNPDKILELRLICDGIWFSIMYSYVDIFKERMEKIVLHYCDLMERDVI